VPAFKGIDMPAACSYHVLIIVLGPFPAVLPAFPACAGVAGGSLRHFLEDANDFKMQQLCVNDHPRSSGMWQHGCQHLRDGHKYTPVCSIRGTLFRLWLGWGCMDESSEYI
jgi:hypothetical protein